MQNFDPFFIARYRPRVALFAKSELSNRKCVEREIKRFERKKGPKRKLSVRSKFCRFRRLGKILI